MKNRSDSMFRVACVLCGVAVALGAFAAHFLKDRLAPGMVPVFEVGVRYQFYHGLALLAFSLSGERFWRSAWAWRASVAWTIGVILFSGSLYLLALTNVGILGAITPLGGVAFLLGWIFAALSTGTSGNTEA